MSQNSFLFQKIKCKLSFRSSHHILHHYIWTFSFIKELLSFNSKVGTAYQHPQPPALLRRLRVLSYKISISMFSWTVSFSISLCSSFPRITPLCSRFLPSSCAQTAFSFFPFVYKLPPVYSVLKQSFLLPFFMFPFTGICLLSAAVKLLEKLVWTKLLSLLPQHPLTSLK